MSLQTQLFEDMKQAMRDKDVLRLDVIRLLRAKIKNEEIDKGDLSDEQVELLVSQAVKQWQDAIGDYQKGGRNDLVEETELKIAVLQEYLPQQLSDEELMALIEQVHQETGLDQAGPLIGKVKQQVGSKASGGRVAQLVQQALSS
jgi:hypothetical protein